MFKRYYVLSGSGFAGHFDGDGEAYDDAGARDAALREASMMSTPGAVITAEVPNAYTGEESAETFSGTDSATSGDDAATDDPEPAV